MNVLLLVGSSICLFIDEVRLVYLLFGVVCVNIVGKIVDVVGVLMVL